MNEKLIVEETFSHPQCKLICCSKWHLRITKKKKKHTTGRKNGDPSMCDTTLKHFFNFWFSAPMFCVLNYQADLVPPENTLFSIPMRNIACPKEVENS